MELLEFLNYHKESGTSYSTLSEVLDSVLLPWRVKNKYDTMTSSNENIFRVTGHLCGEFYGHRWIPPMPVSKTFCKRCEVNIYQ